MKRRTDLIIEAHDALSKTLQHPLEGVEQTERQVGSLRVTQLTIETEEAAQALQRPAGHYITVEAGEMKEGLGESLSPLCHTMAGVLKELLNGHAGNVLAVGLGNRSITPDAVGPQVVDRILVTRHLPPELAEGLTSVCALAPGVTGTTGIETAELIRMLAAQLQPSAILVIDALSARSIHRLGNTFQICDTGISPGSGVENSRTEISPATMGVPVIALGVPTVVDGATLTGDVIDLLKERLGNEVEGLAQVDLEPHTQAILQALAAEELSLMVSPKEVDRLVRDGARALAGAVNLALQPDLSLEELEHLAS